MKKLEDLMPGDSVWQINTEEVYGQTDNMPAIGTELRVHSNTVEEGQGEGRHLYARSRQGGFTFCYAYENLSATSPGAKLQAETLPRVARKTKPKPQQSLSARFEAFHASNPDIYRLLSHYAEQSLLEGNKQDSAWRLINRIRHDDLPLTDFRRKIGNDYIALYARLWLKNNPQHEGFFIIKAMKRA